jgi:predicted N-acetyltransferase YhbS
MSTAAYSIRRMRRPDADAVRQLWSARFGGDPATQKNWIDAALASSHSAVGLVATAALTRDIIGFSLLDVAGPAYVRSYLSLEALDLHPPLADRNGIFHLSSVRSDWEGRGVGSGFYERRLAVLADRGVSRIFGIAWHRSQFFDSRALFEKYDFTPLATVERYYDRFEERPHCPDCRADCTCTASLFAREIENGTF